MRSRVLFILAGALAGAVVASAPSVNGTLKACSVANAATVYLTLPSASSVVELSALETSTLVSTIDGSTTVKGEVSESTVPSVLSRSVSSINPGGPISFGVKDGPADSSVDVVITTVMVFPIVSASPVVTDFTTFWTTTQEIEVLTITHTRPPTTITITVLSVTPTGTEVGDAVSPTSASESPSATASTSSTVLTFDIHQTSYSMVSLSTMLAHSGFIDNSYTAPAASRSVLMSHSVVNATVTASSSPVPTFALSSNSTRSSSAAPTSSPSVASASGFVTSYTSTAGLVPPVKSYASGYPVPGVTDAPIGTPAPSTSTLATVRSTPFYLNSSTATSTSAVPSATPSNCGELGDFGLNFDDIPPLAVLNQSDLNIHPAPVFNPYHQFDFSRGFTVVPPPTDRYLPSSSPLLLEFIPAFGGAEVGPNSAAYGYSGQISDGDHGFAGCFTFNVYGASFGCNSTGPACDFTFTGLHYDVATDTVSTITSQTAPIDACPALFKCNLTSIALDGTFVGLNAIQIKAAAGGEPQGWWMDDIRLGWFNNTCSAGLCRQAAHIR